MSGPTREWESHIARRLKLRDLYILAAVMEWGSMARAASHLAMSQPTVSDSIANLEAVLGVRLLDRSPRGVEPTRYAHALVKRSRVAFDEIGQGIREVEFLLDPTAGEVRVACGDTVAAGLLPAVIDQLSRRHPRIVVHVIQANAETPEYRELRERRVDLALARVAEPPNDEDLAVEMLIEDRHRVVAGARSRWARRRTLTLAEVQGEPWLFPSGAAIRGLIAEAFAACGLQTPRATVNGSSILLRNHLLSTGRFLTVLPASVLHYNARRWSLKALPIAFAVKPRSVAMLMLKDRTPSPVARLFAQVVRSVARRPANGEAKAAQG